MGVSEFLRRFSGHTSSTATIRYDLLNDDVDLDNSDEVSTFSNTRLVTSMSSQDESQHNPSKSCSSRVFHILLTNPAVSWLLIFVYTAIALSLGFYAFYKIEPKPIVDLSITAFSIPNHVVSRRQDALIQAQSSRGIMRRKRDAYFQERASNFHQPEFLENYKASHLSNPLKFNQDLTQLDYLGEESEKFRRKRDTERPLSVQIWSRVQLVYVARNSDNVFTPDRIEQIHRIEAWLTKLEGYEDFCFKQRLQGSSDCMPINSILTYFCPTRRSDGQWYFDGRGTEMLNIEEAIKVAFASTPNAHWYTDGHMNSSYYRSTFIRSEMLLGLPIAGYDGIHDRREEQIKKLQKFLSTLVEYLTSCTTPNLRVLYGGNELFDYQVSHTFWNDVSLAAFAVAAIVLLMIVLTSFSVWLTFWGMLAILLSFPLSFFFYRAVFKISALGILNGAAAFVIVGIGVDDVFVFINTYRQSSHIKDPVERMITMIKVAGKATFLTSFTTAAAFAANMFSSIPAIHDFGVFMTMIVSSCWILVVLLMPPVINIWSRWFACCETKCYRCCWRCKVTSRLKLPQDMAQILSCKSGHSQSADSVSLVINSTRRLIESSEDDVAMLHLENDDDDDDDDDGHVLVNPAMCDDPLLLLEHETRTEQRMRNNTEGAQLAVWFQCLVYNYIAVPVIKARWIFIGLYVILLGVSIGCMTQLRPTSKPPQLYQPDTNLQMLLDLVANYSRQTLNCDYCSGIYRGGVTYQPVYTSPTPRPPITSHFTSPWITTIKSSPLTTPVPSTVSPPVSSQSKSSTISILGSKSSAGMSSTRSGGGVPSSGSSLTTSKVSSESRSTVSESRGSSSTSATISSTSQSSIVTTSVKGSSQSTTTLGFSSVGSSSSSLGSSGSTTQSTTSGGEFHPCAGNKCAEIPDRAPLETGAAIHVVFGIKDIDRSNVTLDKVLTDKGTVIYDERFSASLNQDKFDKSVLADLCRICLAVANNTKLVTPNSAQCIPAIDGVNLLFQSIEPCNLVPTLYKKGDEYYPSSAKFGMRDNNLLWISFSFESRTYKGQSSFSAYEQYMEWEDFIQSLISTLPKNSPLSTMYQTSDFWTQIIMEIVAVTSAIYSLIFSLIICIIAVIIFTGHLGLVLITMGTMIGIVCLVVGMFYVIGWEIGAIEAVSLSIVVGSSIDYCLHIVESYLLTARALTQDHVLQDAGTVRRWRTTAAVTHIGTSVLSSALTTIVAAIPLTQTILLPFSRLGAIIAINTTVAIVYSLTVCISFLATFAPARFTNTWKSTLIAFLSTGIVLALSAAILYCVAYYGGIHIPGPNGSDLFKIKTA